MKSIQKKYEALLKVNIAGFNVVLISMSQIHKFYNFSCFLSLVSCLLILTTSCQKVIQIDLNTANPQLVVEANINNQPGPYIVKLSQTVNFTNITDIPPVEGATVILSDSSGNSESLIERSNGIYMTKTFRGIPGQYYKLSILSNGKTFDAISRMPYPVKLQKLDITEEANDRPSFGGGRDQKKRYRVNYEIEDPVQYKNYYRFVAYHKNMELITRRVFDDQFHNGKIIVDEFGLNDTAKFEVGDTILVNLECIDKATYDFYRTLRDGFGGLGFLSASPANPITNVSDNALGYFSAYSVVMQYAVIPK
jgi:hypothetical protein